MKKILSHLHSHSTALLLIIITGMFLFSVFVRMDSFGKLSPESPDWLTAVTVKFTNNWFSSSIKEHKFLYYENPNSIEFPDDRSRVLYNSYPHGALIPTYLLGTFTGRHITPAEVMAINMITHFFITILMAMTAVRLTKWAKLPQILRFFLPLMSGLVMIFTPATLYYFQKVYFTDQAVLLPFALIIFLLTLYYTKHPFSMSSWWRVSLALTIFWGAYTEWLFFFVTVMAFLVHRKYTIRSTILFFGPMLAAMALFFLHQAVLGDLTLLKEKFFLRTGVEVDYTVTFRALNSKLWSKYLTLYYTRAGQIVFFLGMATVAIVLFSVMKKKLLHKERLLSPPVRLMVLITGSILTQLYFFHNHSYIHNFSILKLSFFFSLVVAVIIPVICYQKLPKPLSSYVIPGIMLALSIQLLWGTYKAQSIFPPLQEADNKVASFVYNHTKYEDVVFSADFAIPDIPPQLLAYSNKRVYRVENESDIQQTMQFVEGDYVVNILSVSEETYSRFSNLQQADYRVSEENEVVLWKIPKQEYEKIYSPGT